MAFIFSRWSYLYPPRPQHSIPISRVGFYESDGWSAQYDKGGQNALLSLSPTGEFLVWDDQGRRIGNESVFPNIKEPLESRVEENTWNVFSGKIVSGRSSSVLYLMDLLVASSQYLLGTTFLDRQTRMAKLLPSQIQSPSHYMLSDNLWRARLLTKNLVGKLERIRQSDDGFVLKKNQGWLSMCDRPNSNLSWQAIVRPCRSA